MVRAVSLELRYELNLEDILLSISFLFHIFLLVKSYCSFLYWCIRLILTLVNFLDYLLAKLTCLTVQRCFLLYKT